MFQSKIIVFFIKTVETLNLEASSLMLTEENKVLSSGGLKKKSVTDESYLVDL